MSLWQNFGVTRKLIFANTSHQVIGKALSVFSTLIISFFLARYWGASGYGDFSKITTFVSLFYLLVDFGLNAVYLQKARMENPSAWWRAFITVRLCLALILFLTAIFFAFFLPGSLNQGYTPFVRLGIIIFASTILFQAVITTMNALFQSALKYEAAAYAVAAGALSALVTMFLVLIFFPGSGVFSGVYALLIGSFITAYFSWYLGRPLIPVLTDSSQVLWREFLALGWPLGLTLLVNLIYVRLDSIILTLTRPTSEVGIYALAYKVFDVGLVLPTFFMNAVYPLLLNRRQTENAYLPSPDFWRLFTKAALVLLILSALVVPFSWLVSPLLSLIHSEFSSSVTAFRILTLSFPWFFLSSLLMWTVIALGGQKKLLLVYLLGLAFNLTLNIYLTPSYGYLAAAWITFGSEALVCLGLGLLLLNIIKPNQKG